MLYILQIMIEFIFMMLTIAAINTHNHSVRIRSKGTSRSSYLGNTLSLRISTHAYDHSIYHTLAVQTFINSKHLALKKSI